MNAALLADTITVQQQSTGEAIVFWVCAIVAVIGALGMLTSKRAVHSALFIASTMISLAVLYVALGVLAALFLLPFYIIVRNAFSTQQWITAASWNWLPNAVNLDTLMRILGNENLGLLRSLGNSAVVTVLQKGYLIAERVLRPALVMVAKPKS